MMLQLFTPPFPACYAWDRPPFPMPEFGKEPAPPIRCIAPLLCAPAYDQDGGELIKPIRHSIWLDSNILSKAKSPTHNQDLQDLVAWAKNQGHFINPMLAIMEQFHAPVSAAEAVRYINEKTVSLYQRYGANLDPKWVNQMLAQVPGILKQDRAYVEILAEFFVIVRHYYHGKKPFEKKCQALAALMRDHLPHLSIAYRIACLYFYVRGHEADFEDGFDKCQKDMQPAKSAEHGRELAFNFAFDIAMITNASLPFRHAEDGSFLVPYIATGDKGLAFLLRELCFSGIRYIQGRSFPWVEYRPGSRAEKMIGDTVMAGLKLSNPTGDIQPPEVRRRKALTEIANSILEGTFDEKKWLT